MLGLVESEDEDMFSGGGFDAQSDRDEVMSRAGSVRSVAHSENSSSGRREQSSADLNAIRTLLSRTEGPGSPFPTIVSSNKWSRWHSQYNECMRPSRCMVINIPITAWRADATNIADVQKASSKLQHCQNQAAFALLSMLTAGTARGVYTGTHPTIADMEERGEDAEQVSKKIKELGVMGHYPFYPPRIPGEEVSGDREIGRQFVWIIELVVDKYRKPVAVRFWKVVDDPSHSDSALWSNIMASNDSDDREGKANRMPSHKRNSSRRTMSTGMRSFVDGDKLEESAEFLHATIRDLHTLSTTYMAYGGKEDSGCHLFGNIHEEVSGQHLNDRLMTDAVCGGLNKLSPEYALNIRRGRPLTAGMVGPQGEPLSPSEELITISSYRTGDGFLRFPERSIKEGLIYISSNGYLTNLFEAALPFPVLNAIRVGDELLKFVFENNYTSHPIIMGALDVAFDEDEVKANVEEKTRREMDDEVCDEEVDNLVTEAVEQALIRNTTLMEARRRGKLVEALSKDPQEREFYSEQLREPIERVFFCLLRGEDELSELQQMVNANRPLGIASLDKTAEERERLAGDGRSAPGDPPREALKVIGEQIDRGIDAIDAWADIQRGEVRKLVERRSPRAAAFEAARHTRHNKLVVEMNTLGLEMLERMWLSKAETRDIPPGYLKKHEALLSNMSKLGEYLKETNSRYQMDPEDLSSGVGTPNMAFGLRKALVGKQSPWGSWRTMLMSIVSGVGMIDGREVRVCVALWMQTNEVFFPFSTVLVVPGEAGVGKSMQTDRMKAIMPDGTFFTGGTRSHQAGCNGKWDDSCGFAVTYDEKVAFFAGKDSETQERAKTMLSMCRADHARTTKRVRADGIEEYVTTPLVTMHYETHIVNTNLGPCMHEGDDAPSDSKVALIDRTHAEHTFDVNPGSHKSDDAFVRSMASSHNKEQLLMIRIFVGLVYKVLTYTNSVTRWATDTSYASELFSHFDKILRFEFELEPPKNRQVMKRLQTLKVCCVEEAIAEKFLVQDTAHLFTEMQPDLIVDVEDPDPERGCRGYLCKWRETLLESVLRRVSVPTPQCILAAWSHALDYNQSTSAHHFWVLKQCADAVGLKADLHTLCTCSNSPPPTQNPGFGDALGHGAYDDEEMDIGYTNQHAPLVPDVGKFERLMAGGATKQQIRSRLTDMKRQRVCRAALASHFAKAKSNDGGSNAYKTIVDAWQNMDANMLPQVEDIDGTLATVSRESAAGYSFPDPTDLVMVGYHPCHLVDWAQGKAVDSTLGKVDPAFGNVESPSWEFLNRNISTTSQSKFPSMLDAGWRILKTGTPIDGAKRWRDNARMVLNVSVSGSESFMKKFGISENTTRDVLWQITKAPNQPVRETRASHMVKRVNEAMTKVERSDTMQEGNFTLGEVDDTKPFIRPFGAVAIAQGGQESANFLGVEQSGWDVTVPDGDPGMVHRNVHTLVANGSLPAASALYSPLVTENRTVRMLPNNQLAFSSDRLAKHQRLFLECAIGNSTIPGFAVNEESDPYNATPVFFKKQYEPTSGVATATSGDSSEEDRVNTLPVSYDMLPVYLTRCMQQTFVLDTVDHIANMLKTNPHYGRTVVEIQDDIPDFCSRFPTLESNSASPVYFEWSRQETRKANARTTTQRSDSEIQKAVKKAEERYGRPLKATDVEVSRMLDADSKTTNMPIGGNLFSFSCWWKNAVFLLSNKGLISPQDDPVVLTLEDSVLGVHSRYQRIVSSMGHMSNYFVVAPSLVGAVPSFIDVNDVENAQYSHSQKVAERVSTHFVGFKYPAMKRQRVQL